MGREMGGRTNAVAPTSLLIVIFVGGTGEMCCESPLFLPRCASRTIGIMVYSSLA